MITREGAGCHLHIQTADMSLEQQKGLVQRCSRQEGKENGKVSRREERGHMSTQPPLATLPSCSF